MVSFSYSLVYSDVDILHSVSLLCSLPEFLNIKRLIRILESKRDVIKINVGENSKSQCFKNHFRFEGKRL